MPENKTQTEETSTRAKKIIKQTFGRAFKILLSIIAFISVILILLVSFLKIIYKDDTADSSGKIELEKFVTYTIA